MNQNRFENSPMKPKKVWIKPTVTIIDLQSARNGHPAITSDSGNNNRS